MELFENAKTFGSLIQVPPKLAAKLPEIEQRLNDVLKHGDLTHAPAQVIKPLLQQAQFLARRYGDVVTNPPYMGSKFYDSQLKEFIQHNCPEAKTDTYTCFIERNLRFARQSGRIGMITIPTWMFLTRCELLRRKVIQECSIESFVQNGRGVWGSDFGSCMFVACLGGSSRFRGVFKKLFDRPGSVASLDELANRFFSMTGKQARKP